MIIGTITLLSILFFGGADFTFEKSFKPFIKEVIEEKDRRNEILDVTKQADSAVKQWRNEVENIWAEDLKRALTQELIQLDFVFSHLLLFELRLFLLYLLLLMIEHRQLEIQYQIQILELKRFLYIVQILPYKYLLHLAL